MVTKNKKMSKTTATKSRVNVGKLQLSKETIKDLTPGRQKQVKGGAVVPRTTRCDENTYTCTIH
jgi:hypothetical protein